MGEKQIHYSSTDSQKGFAPKKTSAKMVLLVKQIEISGEKASLDMLMSNNLRTCQFISHHL